MKVLIYCKKEVVASMGDMDFLNARAFLELVKSVGFDVDVGPFTGAYWYEKSSISSDTMKIFVTDDVKKFR